MLNLLSVLLSVFFFFIVSAHTSSLESGVRHVSVRVHGVLYDLRDIRRRHPSAVGQSVQRPNEHGT